MELSQSQPISGESMESEWQSSSCGGKEAWKADSKTSISHSNPPPSTRPYSSQSSMAGWRPGIQAHVETSHTQTNILTISPHPHLPSKFLSCYLPTKVFSSFWECTVFLFIGRCFWGIVMPIWVFRSFVWNYVRTWTLSQGDNTVTTASKARPWVSPQHPQPHSVEGY